MAKRNDQPIQDTPAAPAPAVLTIGLDIGYGVTKAVAADGTTVKFPSVAGYAREIKFRADELAKRYPGDQITDESGASWFVGDLAMSQLPPGELRRLRGRTGKGDEQGNEFRVRLAKVAIGKLLPGRKSGDVIHVRIATGLPVDHMRGASDLKAALIGLHRIQTDQCDFMANITEVMVMPQPYGTIYSQMLTATGDANPCHTAKRTGVCDVGTYTVDATLDDDGEYIDAYSGSVEAGVSTAQERIAAALEAADNETPSYREVEKTLRTGCHKAHGQEVSYQAEVNEALEPLRSAVLNLLSEKWRGGASVDVIYLSGGGAELVFDQVKVAYPQTELVTDPQLSNARGYVYYAITSAKNADLST